MKLSRVFLPIFVVVSVAAFAWSHDGGRSKSPRLPGLWYTTFFFGPPEPGTPILNAFLSVSSDGTAFLDSTAETGKNPLLFTNPDGVPLGEFIPAHAVWARVRPTSDHLGRGHRGKKTYELRFASFADGGGDGFRMFLFTARVQLDSRNAFSGVALANDVPCETGSFGEPICPNPQDVGYPDVEGNPDANPVIGKRIVFER